MPSHVIFKPPEVTTFAKRPMPHRGSKTNPFGVARVGRNSHRRFERRRESLVCGTMSQPLAGPSTSLGTIDRLRMIWLIGLTAAAPMASGATSAEAKTHLVQLDLSFINPLIPATMHDQHQEFFDRLAAEWDLAFTSEDLERLAHVIARIEVKSGWDILDLGCGTGILFDLLRRRVGDDGSLVGVDFSIEMAEKAHRNFPFDNVSVVDADASMLPFKDSCFDLAVAFSAFPHFTDQQRALDEAHRVLKPGAALHVIHLLSSKELADVHHRVGGVVGHDVLPPREQMQKMFETSRFSEVVIEDHPGLYLARAVNSK
jgi:SAM-dependent methyltransferase